jgi:hypothetical protein
VLFDLEPDMIGAATSIRRRDIAPQAQAALQLLKAPSITAKSVSTSAA